MRSGDRGKGKGGVVIGGRRGRGGDRGKGEGGVEIGGKERKGRGGE